MSFIVEPFVFYNAFSTTSDFPVTKAFFSWPIMRLNTNFSFDVIFYNYFALLKPVKYFGFSPKSYVSPENFLFSFTFTFINALFGLFYGDFYLSLLRINKLWMLNAFLGCWFLFFWNVGSFSLFYFGDKGNVFKGEVTF